MKGIMVNVNAHIAAKLEFLNRKALGFYFRSCVGLCVEKLMPILFVA